MQVVFYLVALLTAVYGFRSESPSIAWMAWIGALAICAVAQWDRISVKRAESIRSSHESRPAASDLCSDIAEEATRS